MNTIIIIVEGGIVQNVITSESSRVVVIDHDELPRAVIEDEKSYEDLLASLEYQHAVYEYPSAVIHKEMERYAQ
jgi:hypothetical protein